MLRFYSMVGMLLFLCTLTFAQSRQIAGRVTDQKDGTGLPGVTVKVKGTNTGTLTSGDGTYKLEVADKGAALVFSFVGYTDQEIVIGNQKTINVSLSAGNKDLSEVVVVGYGTQNKKDLTGAVSKIAAKEIENQPVASLESAIQGKTPGVVIESGSGKVGQGIKVRIRGTSSISANSQPLYVVDGMPVNSTSKTDVNNDPTNPMADINPNDIESIEVLKDAAATAIYGARGSNGVILITTKKGKTGERTKVELNANTTWGRPTTKRGFLNAKDYVMLLEERAANDAKTAFDTQDPNITGTPFPTEAAALAFMKGRVERRMRALALGKDFNNLGYSTDWENAQFRNPAHSQQLDLSASGGTEKTKFYVSGFYTGQEAVVINNKFVRYGGRLNLEHAVSDQVSFGMNLNVSRSQLDRVSNDNVFSTPSQLVAQSPLSPLRDSTGAINNATLYPNGLFDAQFNSNRQVTFRTLGNVFLNYKILPTLSFRSELGADISNLTEDQYIGIRSSDALGKGGASSNYIQNVSLNTNNYFTFTPKLGEDHNLSVTAGMSYLQNDFSTTEVNGELFPSDIIKKLVAAASITYGNSTAQRYTFLSYFGRATYAYKEKYLASVSLRSDGSSRFGPNSRYGWFPAASLGWVASQEDFLKDNKTLNFLKLRVSYGTTGNAEIGENRYLTLLQPTSYPQLPGYRPYQMGNPNLKWEKTKQFDVGVEFGLFDNRLSGEIDYYNKQTSDLLLQANLPYTSGYDFQYLNIGNMENKGVEILLNSININSRNFKWNTSLNVSYNKNRVKDIKGQIIESSGGEQRAVEGQPIGVFYMAKFAGVDPQTGDALYLDAAGKTTSDFSKAERMVVGKSNPDWTGGLTNTFSAYGFDLSAFFSFVQGNSIYNRAGVYQDNGFAGGYDNQLTNVLKRWQKPGDITNVPRLSYFYADGGASTANSRWIFDGSYIRLKSLTLGYTLPKSAINALKISSLRVYVAGYNLWTKTKYFGDPEINSDVLGNIAGGIDYYTIPQAKQITLGVNVKF
ncbi:MAG: TonB-dependent receptor [Chitinophaga sp.]|uniref:SusC/RagA family TonB-linked outer membrane protein n=1 Tax=Chitinophaga sp. TaxID=1869181 RepID=UPI001B29F7E1|nr:TonB-dependent receptor [Chitinophaga sp.]MBO9731935.1 TonB-dependent receptor [Chitinophaga sp.]